MQNIHARHNKPRIGYVSRERSFGPLRITFSANPVFLGEIDA
jgi:hypothetical protein